MKKSEIVPGQLVKILVGNNAGQPGRVKKISLKKDTVALEVAGKIGWYAVGKLDPVRHG